MDPGKLKTLAAWVFNYAEIVAKIEHEGEPIKTLSAGESPTEDPFADYYFGRRTAGGFANTGPQELWDQLILLYHDVLEYSNYTGSGGLRMQELLKRRLRDAKQCRYANPL
jgi:hypothetical protein